MGVHMLIGYVRVSKSDGSQTLLPQRDALLAAGVEPERIYEDLQPGNTLVLWKLDRLGRDLRHLVNTVEDLRVRLSTARRWARWWSARHASSFCAKWTATPQRRPWKGFTKQMKRLPAALRKSMTYDRGSELARHPELARRLKIDIWFADPHAPWQRGSNENTNGLLRQFMPKGTDLSDASQTWLNDVARLMKGRPRKTLGWNTELSRIRRRLLVSNFAEHVTWCRPTFLGETDGPFLGADLHCRVPESQAGSRRVRAACGADALTPPSTRRSLLQAGRVLMLPSPVRRPWRHETGPRPRRAGCFRWARAAAGY